MDLTISYAGKMLTTSVYIKMDAEGPLLLSKGVCQQLGTIQYHPYVEVKPLKDRQCATSAVAAEGSTELIYRPADDAVLLKITVRLVKSLWLPPGHCAVVQVELERVPHDVLKMLEPEPSVCDELGVELSDAVL